LRYAPAAALLFLLFLLAPLAACGGANTSESPRTVAEALVRAMNSSDPKLAIATLPPVAGLQAHFDCPDDDLVQRRNDRASGAAREFSPERAEGLKLAILAFDLDGSETKTLAVGETWRGCDVKKPVRLHQSKATLRVEQDGEVEEAAETWTFLELDGRWYFGKL